MAEPRFAVAGLWAVAVLPVTMAAQIPSQVCVDRHGAPVPQEASTELASLAWASWVGDGQPIIYWNRQAMARISGVSRLFVYLHECAHITLRHIYSNATTIEARRREEREADCWAIQIMLDAGMIKGRHLARLEREWRHARGDLTHQSGAELLQSFRNCLSIRTDPKRWRAALDSLLPAARDSFQRITGPLITESGAEQARESTLDLPGTYDCEITPTGHFSCVVFASRDAEPAARRQQRLVRLLRQWMGADWTIVEQAPTEGRETRRFRAEHATSGAVIVLSSTSGGRVLFLARPRTR